MDTHVLTLAKARKDLDEKKYSAVELAEAHLSNIEKNENLNAYLEVFDDVLEQAKISDAKIAQGNEDVLCGIPLGIKDNILIDGRIASVGSKMLENYVAVYDATVIKKLKDSGAVFLGRTNMDEFAMGASTENSAFGVVKNPHDNSRVAGGSSGGSTSVVSYGGAIAALGSDTGGSVRQPASFCGVVGFKPTYGAVSRYGLIAMGSSLDQIGPITKTVEDAELIFNVIKGNDPLDSTSIPGDLYTENNAENDNRVKRIGIPRHMIEEGIDEDVLKNFEDSLEKLKSLGYEIVDIELPYIKYSLPAYYIIMPAEASTNLSRFDGVRYGLRVEGKDLIEDYAKSRGEGFGPEVRRRILLGTYVLSAGYYDAYYNKAQSTRQRIVNDFENAFKNVDIIATPTAPTPAFKIGKKSDPLSMYLSDVFTVNANLTGMPAISIPSGSVDRDGMSLPVGLQLIAPHMQDTELLSVGKKFERS